MRFKVAEKLENNKWVIYCIEDLNLRIHFPIEHKAIAHDICDFLNDKYYDKEINEEWEKIDVIGRLRYHVTQSNILLNKQNPVWNKHGNGVK